MNDIRKRTTPLSVDPLKTSAATGATLAVMGVDSAIPLLHGSQGCAAFAKVFFVQHFREPLPIQTTAIDAIAAVMGSDDNADGALKLLAERNRPEVIALISSGLTEMQGCDLGRLKREFTARHPELAATAVVTISAPDFCGSFESGYAAAVDALLRQLVRPLPRPQRRANQINLLLTSALTASDVERIKSYISAFGLNAIILPDISLTLDGHLGDAHFNPTATGGCHRLEIAEMGASQATIVIGQSLAASGQWLGEHYAMPVYQFDHLGGLTATDRFIQLLATLSGRPVPATIDRARRRYQDALLDAHFLLSQRPVALAGEGDELALWYGVLAEVGCPLNAALAPVASPALAALPAGTRIAADLGLLEAHLQQQPAALLVGNSHCRTPAARLGLPLLRRGFPLYDWLGASDLASAGYEGGRALLFACANLLNQHEDAAVAPYRSPYAVCADKLPTPVAKEEV